MLLGKKRRKYSSFLASEKERKGKKGKEKRRREEKRKERKREEKKRKEKERKAAVLRVSRIGMSSTPFWCPLKYHKNRTSRKGSCRGVRLGT